MSIPTSELENRFTYHAPNTSKAKKYVDIRCTAIDFANEINHFCPDSREKSLALTKLEEVVMWANASIARNEEA